MGKQAVKKATFQDLINRKLQKESQKTVTKDIYVTSLGKTLTFKKPSDSELLDVIDEMGDMQVTSVVVDGYKKLMYMCCEMLQDTELQKQLEVIDPYDTVDKIFDLSDVMEIGEQLMDLIDLKKTNEKVKN